MIGGAHLARQALALVLLGALGGTAAHARAERLRAAYEVRELVEERARLGNELGWLEGEVRCRLREDRLLLRARALRLEIGTRDAPVQVVPGERELRQ